MTTAAIQLREAEAATAQEAKLVRAWERRRPAWTRTDTARWLSDRSEPLLARLRRRGHAPAHSRQMGYWLKDNLPAAFARAHTRLLETDADTRDSLLIDDVLR